MNKLFIVFILILIGCQKNLNHDLTIYQIKDFFENVSISGGYFSSNEEKLIFSSNKTGIYNVYECNINTGEINQLTSSEKESLLFLCRSKIYL